MLKGRERHGVGEVIAVDRNYVPMQEVSRRRALCAVVAGRAHVLNPATFERHRNLDGGLELIIFPHAQACSDSKLLIGRLERRVVPTLMETLFLANRRALGESVAPEDALMAEAVCQYTLLETLNAVGVLRVGDTERFIKALDAIRFKQ